MDKDKAQMICDAALAHFIATSKPMLISELARQCKTNARTVNAALWDRHPDFSLCEEDVWTGNQWTGRARLAPAVMPSREYLVRLLIEARRPE